MRTYRYQHALIAILAMGVPACALDTVPESSSESELGATNQGLYRTGTIWPNNTPNTRGAIIGVCYKTPGATAGSTDERNRIAFAAKVEGYINNTWGRVANLTFFGWGRCSGSTDSMIEVRITNSGNSSSNIGYRGASRATVVTLNYTDARQPVVAVHEFGHALGFAHEFSRVDWDDAWGASIACTVDSDCTNSNYGKTCVSGYCRVSGGDELVNDSAADFDSVMASTYVANAPNGNTNGIANPTDSLSPYDIAGAQLVYGHKFAGAIVGEGGKCLDIDNPSQSTPTASTRLQVWECRPGLQNQSWHWINDNNTVADGDVIRTNYLSYGSMEIKDGVTTNGTPIWNANFSSSSAQRWRFEDVALVGLGGLCVDVKWGDITAGNTVWLWRCDGNAAQQWTLDQEDNSPDALTELRQTGGGGNSLCLTSKSGAGWQPVDLQPCDGRASQMWGMASGGQLKQTSGGVTRCLDVQGGVAEQEAQLGTYPCWGRSDLEYRWELAQLFFVSGPIRGKNGKCVDLNRNGGVRNGSSVSIWSCHGGVNQVWDVHF